MSGQMGFVWAAYAIGLGAVALMLIASFAAMRRAERRAERLRAERRR